MIDVVDEAPPDLDAAEGRAKLPSELSALWIWSLVTLVLTILVGWLKYRAGATRLNWDPLSDGLFFDLREYPGTYTLLHTSAFFNNVDGKPWPYPFYSPVAYPPFALVVMAPMYAFRIPELLYLTVAGLWLIVLFWWCGRALRRYGVSWGAAVLLPLTLLVSSFPIARGIHQGNIELGVWIFAAVGVWAFMRGWDNAAAVLWALAAAMKLFPLILLGMLLPRGRYRAFVTGIGTFVGTTIISLWWLGPTMGVAWRGSLRNVFGYQSRRMAEWSLPSLVSNHSLIEFAKLAALISHYPSTQIAAPYYVGGALVMAWVFFKKLWHMPVANQLLALSAFMMLFPSISYFHTLVHMYAPLAVLGALALKAHKAGVRVPGLQTTMLLFVPLFAPYTVLTFPTHLLFCGAIQAGVLVALFLRAAHYPLELPPTAAV